MNQHHGQHSSTPATLPDAADALICLRDALVELAQALPVIFVTAVDDAEAEDRCFALDADWLFDNIAEIDALPDPAGGTIFDFLLARSNLKCSI